MTKAAENITPDAGNLVESMRDFGYTLPTALADLIDNSLTASARKIDVITEARGKESHIAVVDDGAGMSKETLINAMRLGCHGPLTRRNAYDLGRFGLGLKTASLSQGRTFTVITRMKASAKPLVRCFDIKHIKAHGWELLDQPAPVAAQYVKRISDMGHGTAVVIENLDRAAFLRVADSEVHDHLARVLEGIRHYLSMVFHRFLDDGVALQLGTTRVNPWDPFLKGKSIELDAETLPYLKQAIKVTPFVLPHHSKLTDDEYQSADGPNGWHAHQGFYIYRCERLIVPGTWLNLQLRKEEYFKLARIRVDLPNTMDSEWHLNVMKSHVAVPSSLRDDFRRIARDVQKQASAVYKLRGEKQAPTNAIPQRYIWRRESNRSGVQYRIDRTHPVIQSLLHAGCDHEEILEGALQLVERSVPIASMLQDPAKAIDGAVTAEASSKLDEFVALLTHAEQFLIRAGHAPAQARQLVLAAEPFVRFREAILNRIGDNASGDTRGA